MHRSCGNDFIYIYCRLDRINSNLCSATISMSSAFTPIIIVAVVVENKTARVITIIFHFNTIIGSILSSGNVRYRTRGPLAALNLISFNLSPQK